jgi:hypothetical protein
LPGAIPTSHLISGGLPDLRPLWRWTVLNSYVWEGRNGLGRKQKD